MTDWKEVLISKHMEIMAVNHMRATGHKIEFWFCQSKCHPPCNSKAAICHECGWRCATKKGIFPV